jgi:hypothetical protein
VASEVVVVRYSVAPNSSRVGHDGWARVRFTPCAPSPLFPQGHAGFRNLGRYLAGWSSRILSSLRKFLQEPRGVLTVSLRPGPSCVVAHEQQRSEGKFLDVGKAFGVQRNV